MARQTSESWIEVEVRCPAQVAGPVQEILAGVSDATSPGVSLGTDDCRAIWGAIRHDGAADRKLKRLEKALTALEQAEGLECPLAVDLKKTGTLPGREGAGTPPLLSVGRRLSVASPLSDMPCRRGSTLLRIEALQAFGDGSHPSTVLALRLLDGLLDGRYGPPPEKGWVLDAGCGTGILGFAAAALGDFAVLGVDTSPEALAAARVNRLHNPVAGPRVVLVRGDLACCRGPFSIVLANLVPSVHGGVARFLWEAAAKGGWFILAGFSQEQKKLVCRPYLSQGAEERATLTDPPWAAVLLSKLKTPGSIAI
jgi:ribosomal protein L11 methylase PrmA